jgi:neurotransmitter:Na+ symporter, NSS family
MSESRGSWGSKLGFILAASGSAIGLGNIVFFPANAYKYGGGAFYIPYLIALFLIGIPVMILEMGVGRMTRKSLPTALNELAGKKGELAGWFGSLNASIITMYYITILGWVVGMWVGSLKDLWKSMPVEQFGLPAGALTNSMSYFFNMISDYNTIVYVMLVWLFNMLIVYWGAKSIEKVVKVFVPAMWLMMIVLIVRGITLPNGTQGVHLLFTPDFAVMKDPAVWKGAFSQMFFTLSLGFGIMTAYASYLPKKNDDVQNATTISLMNCSFEFIAGLAIFSLLFAFAIAPKASTISMMFFVVPEGIAGFPVLVKGFGVLFFTLLLTAGLTSSASLVEAVVASIIDKFQIPRKNVVFGVAFVGTVGSVMFAMPHVIDKGLANNGTLGLTLLDLFDHWAFGYGLLLCGLLECVIIGWLYDLDKLRAFVNENSYIKLGRWFNHLVRFVLPTVIGAIIVISIAEEVRKGMYGHDFETGGLDWLASFGFVGWLGFTVLGAILFTYRKWPSERKGGVK